MNSFASRVRPEVLAEVKASLKFGDVLAFYVVEYGDSRNLSHTIWMRGSRYIVTGMEGEALGSFATFAAASKAGFAASAERLEHGQG